MKYAKNGRESALNIDAIQPIRILIQSARFINNNLNNGDRFFDDIESV